MDNTIRNTSDLEKALMSLTSNENSDTSDNIILNNSNMTDSTSNNNINDYSRQISDLTTLLNQQKIDISKNTKSKSIAHNQSTSGLLINMAGIQTNTNNKLDSLTDAVLRLDNTMQSIIARQDKQIELLGIIARNTITKQSITSIDSPTGNGTSRLLSTTVRDYNFTSTYDVVSELLIKLLQIVEIQISNKGKRYRSSRDLTPLIMNQAVKVACKCTFKIDGQVYDIIKLPDTKNNGVIHVASRIGTVNGISPIMTPASLRDLFSNGECRTFITTVLDIIRRLCIIRQLLPYYEADILSAISHPFFNSDDEIICDWSMIKIRSETPEESIIMTTPAQRKEKIGALIAKGVSPKNAIAAILKDK